MESEKRHIKSGVDYERYFQKADGNNDLIKRHSTLQDTITFLPDAIIKTYKQTALIAPLFRGISIKETCKNIWNWVYTHINYEKDDLGKEQIRSPRRSFADRFRGVDCDDYTVFISSILCNLNIKHTLRVAKYSVKNGFQHIYPVVPIGNGNYITVDCVVDKFNYEVPFIEKIDKPMDLEFLDGIDGIDDADTKLNGIDAEDLMHGYDGEMGDLGRKRFRDSKFFKGLVKVVHVANLVNPGAALLRVGILAALKLNMFKIAERLRFAYLDPDTASRKNFDMGKLQRVVGIKDKLEKIFYGAGGKIANFKKAILKGRGNRSKEVPLSGLGEIDYNDYSEEHNLSQILGVESYTTEMNGVEGLGSLGEPATGAAIAAATTVLAAIAGLLKSIGSLKKGGKGGDPASEASTETTSPETSQTSSSDNDATASSNARSAVPSNANSTGGENKSSTTDTPANDEKTATTTTTDEANTSTVPAINARTASSNVPATKLSTMGKVKKWVSENKLATGAIAVTTVGLIVWGVKTLTSKPKNPKIALSGTPKKSKAKKRKHHHAQHPSNNTHHSKIKYHKLK